MLHIPYNPQTDPRQYLVQALQQGISGYLEHRQRQQFQKGLSPTLTPMQIMRKALQAGLPINQAMAAAKMAPTQQGFTLSPGQQRFAGTGEQITAVPTAPKTEKLLYKDKKGATRLWRGSAEDMPNVVDQIIEAGGTIDTTKSTLSDERLRLYREAKARGDEEAAELALYGKPLVEVSLGKPAAAAERTKIAETRASIDALNNLKTLFDSSQTETGPIVGRIAPTKGLFGLTTDEQEAFMAATSAFKNAIIKEITGAQMSEVEAKRIMKQIPDITDPPTRWLAKWEQSKKNLEFLQKRRLEILEQSGLRVPKLESQIEIPEDIQSMSDEEIRIELGIQ